MDTFKRICNRILEAIVITVVALIALALGACAVDSLLNPSYDLEACSSPTSTSCGSDERVSDRFTTPE